MEILDSQIVGGLIGIGLVVKGFAEMVTRKKSAPAHGREAMLVLQECKNLLIEILAIIRERKD